MSIFKKIRKGFKKIGSSVAKRMRKIGRGVKKGFSKITRAFGKLGPIGHLALFFILPGMGNVVSSWMGQFGSKVMNMLPKGFSKTLTSIGTQIKSAASIITKPLASVYNTVNQALTAGIDAVTAPFMGGQGAATRFQNFVNNTANKFSASPANETMSMEEIAEAQQESINRITGPQQPLDEAARNARIGKTEITAADKKLAADQIARVQSLGKDVNNPVYQFNDQTGKYEIFDGDKLEKALQNQADPKFKMPRPERTITIDKKPGVLRTVTDKIGGFKQSVTGAEIPGTDVTLGEAASVSKDVGGVYSAYKGFTADDPESSFYNPNTIARAEALIPQQDPFTLSSQATNFVSMQPQNNLNNAAQSYVDALKIQGPDPITLALNAPGYGYSFEDYVFGPNYTGDPAYG
tara:strand:- start:4848 stop:6068 length:1221 start_codon:yes stop_codon:yes gene_type:complete